MEPIRRAGRLIRAIEDASAVVRGLPVLNQGKVWNRVRHVGLQELFQFDWTLAGESDSPVPSGGGTGPRHLVMHRFCLELAEGDRDNAGHDRRRPAQTAAETALAEQPPAQQHAE